MDSMGKIEQRWPVHFDSFLSKVSEAPWVRLSRSWRAG